MWDVPGQGRVCFGDLSESRSLLGSALCGRKITFIVDDRDLQIEKRILPLAVFGQMGAREGAVVPYSEFFSKGAECSDVLILRSSRLFPVLGEKLADSLKSFRNANPNSAVILCILDAGVWDCMKPLVDGGVVNSIDYLGRNDFELLRQAAAVLGRMGH